MLIFSMGKISELNQSFSDFDSSGYGVGKHTLKIQNEFTKISDASKNIVLGGKFKENFESIATSKSLIEEYFINMETGIWNLPDTDQRNELFEIELDTKRKIFKSIDASYTMFKDDGGISKTPEELRELWVNYKTNVVPLNIEGQTSLTPLLKETAIYIEASRFAIIKSVNDMSRLNLMLELSLTILCAMLVILIFEK